MKEPRFAKFVVLVNGSVPLALLVWDAWWKQLGANPINFAERTTGMVALVFLVLSLAVTPMRLLSGWNWLSHFRRMLGLFAFFYGLIHLLLYFGFDKSFSVSAVVEDVAKRQFIFFGMAALVLMVPLAMTSTNGAVKRMGSKWWKRLHRLAYLSAAAGAVHYFLLVKADVRQPVAFMVVLGVLLLYRVLVKFVPGLKRQRKGPAPAPARVAAMG